ncbi:putative butyryl-CoA dehydrogenase [delta proteobacterium NaphS2]|nr:putative butyryl-CoA dehydrogenase [delta proteobacterium NaphS2]
MDFELTREQKDIKKAAAEFAQGEFDKDFILLCEADHRFPREIYQKAGELGFIGLDYSEDVGGGGLGVMENVLVIEAFCKADSGMGMAIHLAYLPAKIVKKFGTPPQRKKFLTPLVAGKWVSAVSFTEPDHGSDLTRMETTLEEEADGFVLNGTKIFTTNGKYADFFIVLAQEDPNAGPGKGMSTILVERDSNSWLGGNMEINEITGKMGLRMTSSSEVVFHDLKIPRENILGERGRGLMNVLEFLDESRIEIGAQALGNCEGAFLKALAHARERKQFNRPIIDFQGVGHKLARMWSRIQSLKWLNYYGAWLCDKGPARLSRSIPLITSVVKHHVPETAKAIIDDAITVFGGYGYFLDQEVERRYRDNRIVEVYEGTVEVQLNNIVRVLGKMPLPFLDTELL